MDDEHVGQHHEFSIFKGQLHNVTDFIPSETHKSLIILNSLTLGQDHLGLEIRFPLDFVRGGGRPPFGKVGRLVTTWPFVITKSVHLAFI